MKKKRGREVVYSIRDGWEKVDVEINLGGESQSGPSHGHQP